MRSSWRIWSERRKNLPCLQLLRSRLTVALLCVAYLCRYDVLFACNSSAVYWWFAQVLWLKTIINVLYSAGQAEVISHWHIWMACVLGISVFLMANQRPYISNVDQQVEIFAMINLCVQHTRPVHCVLTC
eukprot:COSAG01_NODE_2216_length_8154_cov_4.207945_7_plen_130_part_00